MHHSMRHILSLFSCIVILSMALTACNIPGFTTSTSSGSSGSDNGVLKLGQISTSVAFFPFYVAEQQGYFKKEGVTLDGTPPLLGTGGKVADAVEANSIEVGGGTLSDAFTLARVDSSAKLIGSLVNSFYVDITVSKAFSASSQLTESSSLQAKVLALKGKKIGITGPGSATSALVIYLFRKYGLDASRDVTLVNLGATSTAALGAMKAGRVDALSFFSPVGPTAIATGIGDPYISPDNGDVPDLNGAVLGAFYTKQSVIDAKPKTIAAFIRGVADAEAFIQSDQATALKMLTTYLKLKPTIAKAIFNTMVKVWAKDPTINQNAFDITANFHVSAGLISIAPHYDAMVAASTISAALKK
jgi:NitT/TauT family transport system substrate-binding protein